MKRGSEIKVAKDIGAGKPQPGSGAPWGYKGDVRLHGVVRVQDKETSKKSYPIKVEDWLEIEEQALKTSEIPSFTINFSKHKIRLAVISYEDWLEFVEHIKNKK